jgi:hypothetical protein
MTSGTMLREWFQSVLGRRCEVLETRYRTVAALRRALRGEHTLLAGVGLKLKTQRLILRALRPAPAAVAPSVTPHSAVLAALPPPLPKARKLSSSCSPGNCCATAPPIEATTSSSTSSSCTSLPAVVAAEDLANSSGFGKRMLQKMGWSGAGTKPANRPVEALATSERRGLGAAPLVSAESLLKKAAAGASSTAVMATKFLVLAAAQEQVVVGLEGEHVQEVVRISGGSTAGKQRSGGREQTSARPQTSRCGYRGTQTPWPRHKPSSRRECWHVMRSTPPVRRRALGRRSRVARPCTGSNAGCTRRGTAPRHSFTPWPPPPPPPLHRHLLYPRKPNRRELAALEKPAESERPTPHGSW